MWPWTSQRINALADREGLACSDPMPPAELRYWTTAGRQAGDAELTRLRDAAGKWRNTIDALTGVSIVATMLTQYDRIRALTDAYQTAAVILLLLALGAVVLAVTLASQIEIGPLTLGVLTPGAICTHHRTELAKGQLFIRDSKRLTLASVAALVVAIGLLGYGPHAAPTPASYVALPAAGAAICGPLATSAAGDLALLPRATGTPVPLRDATGLVAVTACP